MQYRLMPGVLLRAEHNLQTRAATTSAARAWRNTIPRVFGTSFDSMPSSEIWSGTPSSLDAWTS
eukprot:7992997-Lingulodinium_polyedra.AAC.1